MTGMQKAALAYVKSTGRCATVLNFIEDHDPIGKQLWRDLSLTGMVVEEDGRIVVTELGQQALDLLA